MTHLNCVFCGTEVTSPPGLNDSTAKAICESCVARGGRLPYMDGPKPWKIRVDSEGRAYQYSYGLQFNKAWMRGYFFRTPLDASLTTFSLLLFGGLLLAFLIKAPLPTICFFALTWVIYWTWSKILPNWK